MVSRKGMSPLIATILLMAFAVALGGMIMNWSIDRKSTGDCDLVKLHLNKFCVKGNNILLSARNEQESVAIQQLRVSFMQGGFENSLSIVNSKLTPGQPLDEIMVPATVSSGTKVSLIGVLGTEENPITCTSPIIDDPIKEC